MHVTVTKISPSFVWGSYAQQRLYEQKGALVQRRASVQQWRSLEQRRGHTECGIVRNS